ncbi:MAG: isochorismatase family protein, partial [Anaerolineae bacterium]|nr:isochorismatase family protein [Anaerolineae bacterium]
MLPLVDFFRQHKMPIFYATMQPHNRPADDPLLAIVDPLTPQPEEPIIRKQFPSAFFQTTLADDLRERGCDSVILCGNSTSGCVRTAAVDAVQHGFGVTIPYECVFDRIEASHMVGLLDLWMKTATVLSSEEVLAKLKLRKEEAHAN